jgi:hypothetical protein
VALLDPRRLAAERQVTTSRWRRPKFAQKPVYDLLKGTSVSGVARLGT